MNSNIEATEEMMDHVFVSLESDDEAQAALETIVGRPT